MRFSPKFIALITLPTLAGCGAFKTSDSGQKGDQVNPQLAAEWDSNCAAIGFMGFASKASILTIGAIGDFDRETQVFSAAGCASGDQALSMKVSGTYDIVGDANIAGEAAKNINFTVNTASLTPTSQHAVDLLNAASYCGVTAWQTGTAVDIAGKDCAGESLKQGAVVFDVYEQAGNDVIYFGNAPMWFDRTSSGDRPTALDKSVTFSRKK